MEGKKTGTKFAPRLVFMLLTVASALLVLANSDATWAQEPAESSPAAIKQYRDAVAFQNRAVYDLAADEWKKFLKEFGKDPLAGKAQHYLAICQLQQKQYQDAITSFQKALKDFPSSDITEQTYLNLGLAQYSLAQDGKSEAYDDAAKTFETLIAKYPEGSQRPQGLFYLAEALYARGKKAEAAPIYAQFIDGFAESPLRPDALYALGVTQEELNQPKEAAKTYDRFLKDFAEHALRAEITMRRAETMFAQQQFEDAEKWFGTAAAAPDFKLVDYALVRQAASLYELKRYADAAALYASVIERFPETEYLRSTRLAAGNCYYLAGNHAEAQKWLRQAVDAGGRRSIEAAHWLAKSLLKEKKAAEALALVERILPEAGTSAFAPNLKMDRADALFDLPARRSESVALYAAVAKEYPDNALASQALYMAAISALGDGKYKEALQYANEFLGRYANDALAPDVRYVAAEANLQLAAYANAEKLYQELVAQNLKHADAEKWQLRLGVVQFLQKKHAETIATLTAALPGMKNAASQAEANYLIGNSLTEQQQLGAAVKAFKAALAASPNWRQADETWLNLATAHRQANQLKESREAAAKVIADFPQSAALDRAHFRLGDVAYAENNFPTAITEFRTVIETWPKSTVAPNALYSLGWALIGEKKYAEALEPLNTLIQKHADHSLVPRGKYARAIALQQTKEFAKAIEDLQAFLNSQLSAADKADALYVSGLCEAGQQNYAKAAETFAQIAKENPQYTSFDKVLYEWGWALKSAKQDPEAVEVFARLAKEKPGSLLAAESLYHVGESQYTAADYAAAAQSYFDAMNLAAQLKIPGDLTEKASHKLAWSYYQQNQYDKAAKAFEYQIKTFEKGSLAADARFMAAESLFKQNKFAAALAAYQKSLAAPPENREFQTLAHLHAGQAAAQAKNWNESLKVLNQAAEQFTDSAFLPEIQYEQAWALQNQGKSEEAMQKYEQVAEATDREVGARARFMMGELLFDKKDYKEAIRNFFKVAYGYGYPDSPDATKVWQANAAFEAARCFETLAGQDQAKKAQMLDQARKSYREVLEKYPQSDKRELAQNRLESLGS